MEMKCKICTKCHVPCTDPLAGLADCMQRIAGKHAKEMGYGFEAMAQNDQLWALSRLSVKIHSEIPEEIIMHTESIGTDGLFYYRDFQAYSENILVAEASSAWIIMDYRSRMPLRNAGQGFREIGRDYVKPVKLPGMKTGNVECVFNVHELDLDVNKHVNNVTYIKWAVNYSGISNISEFHINFIKECFIENEISVYLSKDINGVVLQESGRDIARAIVTNGL